MLVLGLLVEGGSRENQENNFPIVIYLGWILRCLLHSAFNERLAARQQCTLLAIRLFMFFLIDL